MARHKKSSESVSDSVIKPLIRVEGENHLLEDLNLTDEAPVLKSVGFTRLTDGKHGWISYTIITQGHKVLSIEPSEPDLRSIAEENAKIAFVSSFMDQEAIL